MPEEYDYYRPTQKGNKRVGFSKPTLERRKRHRRMKNKIARQSRKQNR